MFSRWLFVIGVVLGGGALLAGLDYYVLPIAERPFSPMHAQFAPTGLVGQGFGIAGTLMMAVGVVSYGARKRLRSLAKLGRLKSWLQFHIFLCLLGPFLVLLHTTFKFGGLVAIAFWSMTLVVASGVFGRWVYVWIPKSANGRFLGREEIRDRLHSLLRELEGELGMTSEQLVGLLAPLRSDAAPDGVVTSATGDRRKSPRAGPDRRRRVRRRSGIFGALADSFRQASRNRVERARFNRELAARGVPEPTRSRVVGGLIEERRLEQQLRMLEPFQAAFRYWHAFHLPLAVVMVVILVLHVGVSIAFGYTWIWAV
ncbi:MAG: hypothetical protein ABL963_05440 [Longimicrobiales bacterium]